MKKISIIIHGSFNGNMYKQIFYNLNRFHSKDTINTIVIVSYLEDKKKTEAYLKLNKNKILDFNIKTRLVKDLLNPGFFNINRQVLCVSKGLDQINSNDFIIKLRNDQCINFNKLYKRVIKGKIVENNKILSTNCFTRSDRLYHPSDMLLCATKNLLDKYYSMPYMSKTHLDCILEIKKLTQESNGSLNYNPIAPESELFKHYLKINNWHLENTREDSFNALNKYFYIVNSWDISFKWNKKRTPFLPSGSIILPYYLNNSLPFDGGPVETARCYHRHNFDDTITLKDIFFLFVARICFYKKQLKSSKKHKRLNIYKRIRRSIFKKIFKKTDNKKLKLYLGNRI